ncbi:V-type ATP synthase subunit F [Lachnospiraceae bacterium MD1]|uniref:V-type ATP synthase subunit F n=1 Tax=Variimorphobacter saccharofermentans TaxID=2755051 RepID=A0A839JZR0_9FIRM|nr:V-type ATP synthase subunit F [Variimorphobacter saccharofermentans]MBB2183165.1 V-type ATP synthase subunit F [Variimorphobacter saccharofermentans]
MYKVAVLGDRDSIYGYAALGLDTYPVSEHEEAAKTLKTLAEGQYAVIYITESLQAELETEIDRYVSEYLPAIIPIPGVSGNTGKGMRNVKKSVERAVGSDIIFNNEN